MRILALSLAFTLTVLVVGAALWFGKDIPFQQQWPLYEALRATAAIIFAVVGAWLAIVYPERLRLSFNSSVKPLDNNSAKPVEPVNDRFTTLFTPIAHSTIILGMVLIAGISAPIAKQIPFLLEHRELARTASFVLLVVLTLWQVWTVVLTLYPADIIKSQADRDIAQQKTMNAIRGLGSVQARDPDGCRGGDGG